MIAIILAGRYIDQLLWTYVTLVPPFCVIFERRRYASILSDLQQDPNPHHKPCLKQLHRIPTIKYASCPRSGLRQTGCRSGWRFLNGSINL
jgi:hypothetical protein